MQFKKYKINGFLRNPMYSIIRGVAVGGITNLVRPVHSFYGNPVHFINFNICSFFINPMYSKTVKSQIRLKSSAIQKNVRSTVSSEIQCIPESGGSRRGPHKFCYVRTVCFPFSIFPLHVPPRLAGWSGRFSENQIH